MTFAQSLGLNPDDYVSLTSYTHHPFYSQFAIEIQDNWRNGLSYNLPLDEFMAVDRNDCCRQTQRVDFKTIAGNENHSGNASDSFR